MTSAYMTFHGGEELEFEDLTGERGFARLYDRRGALGELLRETARTAAVRREKARWIVTAALYRAADILHSSKPSGSGWELVIGDEGPGSGGRGGLFAERVRKYLAEHLADKIGNSDIARRMGSSVSSVFRRYKAAAGESPMRTLAAMRISAVKNLLSKGEPLKSIAAQTGFFDEFHLSKTFKRLTGVPPSRFMERAR
jgi:AraC-like DNA-binding protein